MKKIILFGAICALVSACTGNDSDIVCGEYNVSMNMSDDGETLTAVINGDEMTLNHAISASGARYVGELNDTIVTLWNQGTDWTMFLNDGAPIECTSK